MIGNPVRTAADVERLRPVDVTDGLAPVFETVRLVRAALGDAVPLIGFAGAPFTVACYAIEGGASRHFVEDETACTGARTRVARADGRLERGAGRLPAGPDPRRRRRRSSCSTAGSERWPRRLPDVRPAAHARLVRAAAPAGRADDPLRRRHDEPARAAARGGWRRDRPRLDGPARRGWARMADRAVQGNLDPIALFAPWRRAQTPVHRRAARAAGRPGHIFNLGHGVLPDTPVDRCGPLWTWCTRRASSACRYQRSW